jgi:hypothetical protein
MCEVIGNELTEKRLVRGSIIYTSMPLLLEKCQQNSSVSCITLIFCVFYQLPVFMKLCQDGVWGVRKVSSPPKDMGSGEGVGSRGNV